jgi:hypothetical protein
MEHRVRDGEVGIRGQRREEKTGDRSQNPELRFQVWGVRCQEKQIANLKPVEDPV